MAKTDALRQKEKRERDKAHLAEVGAEPFSMLIYKGTAACLDRLQKAGSFSQRAEVLTVLIHNVDDLLKRDMSQKEILLSVSNLRKQKEDNTCAMQS